MLSISDFDDLMPITMTIIASINVTEINLAAIFLFLPTTKNCLPKDYSFQRKQGKIILPKELNIPGEIISMRFGSQVRGIVRSEKSRAFPNAVIIDIGTSDRIISVKLSKSIEFTGPRSFDTAKEAIGYIINYIKETQETINIIQRDKVKALNIMNKFLNRDNSHLDDEELRIWTVFDNVTNQMADDDIKKVLEMVVNFNHFLYQGNLEVSDYKSDMVNIQFNLGHPISLIDLSEIIDEPFYCKYSNAYKSNYIIIIFPFVKYDKITGFPKDSRHTIQVSKTGHVKHSGPDLESMKPVYYAFMRKLILAEEKVISSTDTIITTKVIGPSIIVSMEEYNNIIAKRQKLKKDIVDGLVPIAKSNKKFFSTQSIVEEVRGIADAPVSDVEYCVFTEDEVRCIPYSRDSVQCQ
jgi:hypothetical protein